MKNHGITIRRNCKILILHQRFLIFGKRVCRDQRKARLADAGGKKERKAGRFKTSLSQRSIKKQEETKKGSYVDD